jgi:hypothetical protein
MTSKVITAYQGAAKAELLKNNPGILETFKARVEGMSRALSTMPVGRMPSTQPR